MATSREQIEEFRRAASYPRLKPYLPRPAVGRIVNELRRTEVMLTRLRRAGDSPDPGDDYLLAMAIAADADFLVTGDTALQALQRVGAARIISPRGFLRRI